MCFVDLSPAGRAAARAHLLPFLTPQNEPLLPPGMQQLRGCIDRRMNRQVSTAEDQELLNLKAAVRQFVKDAIHEEVAHARQAAVEYQVEDDDDDDDDMEVVAASPATSDTSTGSAGRKRPLEDGAMEGQQGKAAKRSAGDTPHTAAEGAETQQPEQPAAGRSCTIM